MSGIFSAIKPFDPDTKIISTHMLDSILFFAVTGHYTNDQIKTKIESVFRILSDDESNDIQQMLIIIESGADVAARHAKFEAVRTSIDSYDSGTINETEAREFWTTL